MNIKVFISKKKQRMGNSGRYAGRGHGNGNRVRVFSEYFSRGKGNHL